MSSAVLACYFKAKKLIIFVIGHTMHVDNILLYTTEISTVTVFTNVRNLITFIPHTTTN